MLDLTTCALLKLGHFLRTFNIHIIKYNVRLNQMDTRDFVSFLMVWMYKGIFLKHAYIQIKHTNTASACLTFVTIFWLWLWVSLAMELISCQKPPLPEPTKHLRGDPINSQPRPIVSTNTFKANVTIRCRVEGCIEKYAPRGSRCLPKQGFCTLRLKRFC